MGQQYTLEFEERLNKRILSLCNEQIPDLSRNRGSPNNPGLDANRERVSEFSK